VKFQKYKPLQIVEDLLVRRLVSLHGFSAALIRYHPCPLLGGLTISESASSTLKLPLIGGRRHGGIRRQNLHQNPLHVTTFNPSVGECSQRSVHSAPSLCIVYEFPSLFTRTQGMKLPRWGLQDPSSSPGCLTSRTECPGFKQADVQEPGQLPGMLKKVAGTEHTEPGLELRADIAVKSPKANHHPSYLEGDAVLEPFLRSPSISQASRINVFCRKEGKLQDPFEEMAVALLALGRCICRCCLSRRE
jgi:hypothetical protein